MDARTLRLRRELLTTLDQGDLAQLQAAARQVGFITVSCSDNLPEKVCNIVETTNWVS